MRRLWLWVRYRLEYVLVRAARGLDWVLGPARSAALASVMGRFVYRRLRIRASVVEDQLRHAFPDRDEAWIRATAMAAYEHLGREAMMMIRLSRLGREAVIEATEMVEGWEDVLAALNEGNGAVITTGHFGNWEVSGAAVASRGVPVLAVARRQNNPLVDRLINENRARLGMTIVSLGGATKHALRALSRGHVVGLVADQDARQRGLFVPFFGRKASTFRGPALLALRAGSPLFVATVARHPDGHYVMKFRRIPVPEAPGPEGPEWAMTAAMAAELEAEIRTDPAQYLWHHRRWKTRPPEERRARKPAEQPGNGEGGHSV